MNEFTDNKHGVPKNEYEREIRELNRKVYGLYQKIEQLARINDLWHDVEIKNHCRRAS